MLQIEKIITHGGFHHADEISAISLLRIVGVTAPVERVFKVSDEQLKCKNTLVLDIGREFNPNLLNLDHHQDPSLKASNCLVLDLLVLNNKIKKEIAEILENRLFTRISDIDTGVISGGGSSYEFNSFIRNEPNFEKAIGLAKVIIGNLITSAEKVIETKEILNSLERVGSYLINDSKNTLVGWKELAPKGIKGMLAENPRGGWQITSICSNKHPIVECGSQTFLHNSAFMAVYVDKTSAINHALEMSK